MKDKVSRRDFMKSGFSYSLGLASILVSLRLPSVEASGRVSFFDSDGNKYNLEKLFSNGMIFSDDENTPNINKQYFIADTDNQKGIDLIDVYCKFRSFNDKKSLSITVNGYVDKKNGYFISNKPNSIKIKGHLFNDEITEINFEDMLYRDFTSNLVKSINNYLPSFNEALNFFTSNRSDLKKVSKNFHPFEAEYRRELDSNISKGNFKYQINF